MYINIVNNVFTSDFNQKNEWMGFQATFVHI